MEIDCYRCGQPVDENSAFCPACGAPQIKVARREEDVPAPPAQPELQSPVPPLATMHPEIHPREIEWKRFLRMAWLPAVIAGLATGFYAPVGLLIVMPLTIVMTIRTYLKQHPLPLRAGQGARMGSVAGVMSFVAFAFLLLGLLTVDGSRIREDWTQAALQAAARNPDPHVQEMLRSLVSTDQGFYLIVGLSLVFFLIIVLVLTALTGAAAASTFSRKRA